MKALLSISELALEVRHILSPSQAPLHELHRLARQDGDDLVYPAAAEPQLGLFTS